MVAMKLVELAHRNRGRCYWIAATDPAAADRVLTGAELAAHVPEVAVCTDGAARLVDVFADLTWSELLAVCRQGDGQTGTDRVLDMVRAREASDPIGERWPRKKSGDDATLVYAGVPDREEWS